MHAEDGGKVDHMSNGDGRMRSSRGVVVAMGLIWPVVVESDEGSYKRRSLEPSQEPVPRGRRAVAKDGWY